MTDRDCGATGRNDTPAIKTLALELADLLPSSDERCADRLTYGLAADVIIKQAHLVAGETRKPRLCVHYDASAVTASDVQLRARQAAQTITSQYGHLGWSPTDRVDDVTIGMELVEQLQTILEWLPQKRHRLLSRWSSSVRW